MKGEELSKLLLDGLVAHDCGHVCPEHVHVLADGDLMFLGLILVRIESGSQVMDLVL